MNKRTLRLPFFVLLLACLALAGCEGNQTGKATETPNKVLFQDDFSDPNSGWNRVSEANGESDYADGVYRILVNVPNTDIWARPGLDFTDTRIEVDTLKVGGDRDNRFGIVCRLTGNSSFYLFMISTDGYYGIGKITGQKYELIGMDALLPSEDIQQGSAVNHLRADCVGDQLTFYVNGKKLAEVQDADFKSGDVGLIAGAYKTPGTDIRFDNFTVMQP